MFSLFPFLPPPEEGERFTYDKDTVKRIIYRSLRAHTVSFKDYPYNIKVKVICLEGLFKRICSNVNWAGHDAWQKLMKKLNICYSHEGPAYQFINWSEGRNFGPNEVAVEVDADGEPIYSEQDGTNTGGTTTVLQDESVNKYYRPASVPYARRCTDRSMELWVRPLGVAAREDKNGAVSLNLIILGGAAGEWAETDDKVLPVFSSQRSFFIGGVNAPPSENVFRLKTDTVSDRHLEVRKRKGFWEARALEGIVYIDGELMEPGSGWIQVDDSMDITLNDTTIKIESNG